MSGKLWDADLAANLRQYRMLVELAVAAGSTNADSLLAYMGAAADSAWHHHPGFFADRELEGLLSLPGPPRKYDPPARASQRERVLHVLTQASTLGGHTRLAERWMQLDAAREHSVALTWQAEDATPSALADVVRSRGGGVHYLDRRPGGLSSRAARLERLAAGFDYVVLHTHPSDPIPLAAFRTRRSYSILLVNHADHVFWLGTTVADLVVSIREVGRSLCNSRRGIATSRMAILPVPIPPAGADIISGTEAKQQLGLPVNANLVLTVASGSKFSPSVDPGFVEVHVDILKRYPNLYHIVVGIPPGSAAWERARSITNGRLNAVAATADLEYYWAAADVYVDSFPISSLTSALEAMSHAIPCVSFDPFDRMSPVLKIHDTDQMPLYFEGTDMVDYEQAILRLASDPVERGFAGKRAIQAIHMSHWGEGWRKQLESVYTKSRDLASLPDNWLTGNPEMGGPSRLDRNLAAHQATYTPLDHASSPVSAQFLTVLPRRLAIEFQGFPRDWRSQLRMLLPGWALFAKGSLARSLRAIARRDRANE